MGSYRLRAAIYALLLAGCLIGWLVGSAPMVFAWGFFLIAVSQFFFLCPRCGKHVDTKGNDEGGFFYWVDEKHHEDCPRCGRSRHDVWMLQFFLKREKWDGVRQDESDV
jgi:hypothetical protein